MKSLRTIVVAATMIASTIGAVDVDAQISPLVFDTSTSSIVQVNYRMNYESNSLTNDFATKLKQGSFLSRELLQDVYAELPNFNTVGFIQQSTLRLFLPTHGQSRNKGGYYLGIQDLSFIEAEFNPDLFGLVFLGNKAFAGREVILSNESFRQLSYQSVHAGYMKLWGNDSSHMALGISAALLKGQNILDVNIRRGKVYTSTLGDEIQLDMDYLFTRSDTQYTEYLDMNGYGLGLGLFVTYRDANGVKLSAQLDNLGGIRWVNNRYNYHKDSSMVFRGWEVENIFELDGKVFEDATLDSLYSVGIAATHAKDRWIAAPSLLQFDVSVPLHVDWLSIGMHAEHLLFTQRMPLLAGGPEFNLFHGRWTIMPYFSTGGYNTNSIGIKSDLNLSRYWMFSIGSNSLDGFLQPSARSGQSVYFMASHKFEPNLSR